MKFSNFSRLFTAGIFVWLLTISAMAQDTGGGFGSYTSINYDEDTNIVTAYSQTDTDYSLMGDYEARVSLTVTNDYGVIVASGSGYDDGSGVATVELSFAGEPDRTYTAVGTHRAFAYLYDYDYDYDYYEYPYYRQVYYYYDNWYFTGFAGGGIYQPWYYSFYRPSYNYYRRQTNTINLGRTYDSVSIIQAINRGSLQAQGPDISRQDAARMNGTTCSNVTGVIKGGYRNGEGTISWSWARATIPTKTEAMAALTCLEYTLTSTQRSHRNQRAFPEAASYIAESVRDGRDVELPKSWRDPGQSRNRVDITIFAGRAFSGTLLTAAPQY